jgi:hypothetical protein
MYEVAETGFMLFPNGVTLKLEKKIGEDLTNQYGWFDPILSIDLL